MEDYEKKMTNLNITLNIERSARVNKTRIDRMKERNTCVEKVREDAHKKLSREIC